MGRLTHIPVFGSCEIQAPTCTLENAKRLKQEEPTINATTYQTNTLYYTYEPLLLVFVCKA